MEMVTIYHPVLEVTETVNAGLAGVLIDGSGWEVAEIVEADEDEGEVVESVPRSEAMPEKKSPAKKKVTKPKKESD